MMLRGRVVFFSLLLLFFVGGAHAQFEVGSIVGVVTDPGGSRIPGAKVEVVQTATNSSRTSATTDSGEYAFVGLVPGTYTLTVASKASPSRHAPSR